MSDPSGAIPLGLAQQKAARDVDPDQLESMGKRAAALFAEGVGSLSDAVVEVVKEARLAPEQVKRVCEFTNTAAYLSEFEKGGAVRNVTFDGGPANPSVVLKDLNDGSSPAIHQVKEGSYQPPTSNYKLAGAGDAILAEAFGAGETIKTADQHGRASSSEEIVDLRIRLKGIQDDLQSKYASSGILLNDIRESLCDAARQEVLQGSTLGDIAGAWSSVTPDALLLKEAMSLVGSHLIEMGDLNAASLRQSIVKTASKRGVPNIEHPVMDRFIAFTKIATEHRKLESGLTLVSEQLDDVNKALRGMA